VAHENYAKPTDSRRIKHLLYPLQRFVSTFHLTDDADLHVVYDKRHTVRPAVVSQRFANLKPAVSPHFRTFRQKTALPSAWSTTKFIGLYDGSASTFPSVGIAGIGIKELFDILPAPAVTKP
jgi:hypothetical protein